jgi:hypothetical protein
MPQFKTSNGEILDYDDERLIEACRAVAKWKRENAYGIRGEDLYASHVSEQRKDEYLRADLRLADQIERGEHLHSFWCWQRVNQELTGECVGFLGNGEK